MYASRFAQVCYGTGTVILLAAALGGCQMRSATVTESAKQPVVAKATASPKRSAVATASAAAVAKPKITTPPTTPCATSDLSLTPAQRHVNIGVQIERLTITTSNPDGCTLTGPLNLSPKGPLSTQIPGATVDLALSEQTWPDDLDVQPPSGVTVPLLPGQTASVYLAWFAASPIVCVQSSGFGFNAPGDTTYSDMRDVSYPIGPICDGVFYVSPVF